LRVEVNGVVAKRVKFSLSNSVTNKGAICDEEYKDEKLAT
jgi:hypothetical protein